MTTERHGGRTGVCVRVCVRCSELMSFCASAASKHSFALQKHNVIITYDNNCGSANRQQSNLVEGTEHTVRGL